MASLDTISIGILFGSLLVLAGILSSLVAMRFGAPLLLAFLLVGMLAGEAGPLGIRFDDVELAYTVGSVALGLILFDGGLRTRFQTFRNVIGPAGMLATVGVLVTAALTAPAAVLTLGLELDRSAADGRGHRLDRRRGRVLPAACARLAVAAARQRDPGGRIRHQRSVRHLSDHRAGGNPARRQQALAARSSGCWRREAILGGLIGYRRRRVRWCSCSTGSICRRGCTRRSSRPARSSSSRSAQTAHGSGFLAVYIAGLVVGNSATRAHNTVVVFLDAATWLAQIAMFVLLGLLAWPRPPAGGDLAGAGGGRCADADRKAGGGVSLPGAVPLQPAREAVHLLGGPARSGRYLHRLDPAAGRAAECPPLFRRGLHRRAGVAAGAGLDHRAGGAVARRFVSPQ